MTILIGNVPGVAGAYMAQLNRYKKAMTGDVGAIEAGAVEFEARAAGGRAVMSDLGRAASDAGKDWNSPSGYAFRGMMSTFTTQVDQVVAGCSSAGTALRAASSALRDATSSIDEIIRQFTAAVQKLAAQTAADIQRCIAGTSATTGNSGMHEMIATLLQRRLEDAVNVLGRQALDRAVAVETSTNGALAGVEDALNHSAVNVTISDGARNFRSDYGNVNPWAPARSLMGLFGGQTQAYDLRPQVSVPATTLGYAALGLPFNTASGTAFRLREPAIEINGKLVTMTPGLAFMRTLTSQPRSFLGDAFLAGGANPAYTNVHYFDNSSLDYAASLAVNTATPTLMDWASKTIGVRSGNALSMDSGLHLVTMAALTPTVEGMLRMSDLVAPNPSPVDPNNDKYWQALLTRSGLVGAGVTIPIVMEMGVDQLTRGTKINPVITGLSFGLPVVQNVGSELLFGPPPPHPNDPLYAIPHSAGQWAVNDLGNLDNVLRSSRSPSDGALQNLVHAAVLGGEAVLTPVVGTVLEGSNPGRPIGALSSQIGYVFGGPHPEPLPPIVPEWSTQHAVNALDQGSANLREAMHQPQIKPADRVVASGLNTLAGVGHSLIGVGEHLAYPYAYAHGKEGDLTESIQQRFNQAGASFHRASDNWYWFPTGETAPGSTPTQRTSSVVPGTSTPSHISKVLAGN